MTASRKHYLKELGLAFALSTAAVLVMMALAHADDVLGVERGHLQKMQISRRHGTDSNGNVVGRRPHGCPRRFCGCEASLYVFGKVIPELNLAWNWARKFPRTSPAPGMAAARRGHVMILMSHVSGSDWLVHDGNSGGGLTREHVRSIKGYVIVDPSTQVAGR